MEEKKVLLSIKDLSVKFRVRGRILTAIRGISLDIYENESIAIVGESGSGKSVFTKTFAGMLDSNGFVSEGKIIYDDPYLADVTVTAGSLGKKLISYAEKKLNEYSSLELGAETYKEMLKLDSEKKSVEGLSEAERASAEKELKELNANKIDAFNERLALHKDDKEKSASLKAEIKELDRQIKVLEKHIESNGKDTRNYDEIHKFMERYNSEMPKLKERYQKEISAGISEETKARNTVLAKEIYLAVGSYGRKIQIHYTKRLIKALKKAMELGVNLMNDDERNQVFDSELNRVKFLTEEGNTLHGKRILNLASVKFSRDWTKIRGTRIATVFQDPMTSLNPIITIGKQITSVILKHQECSEAEARRKALELMDKVGIPNAEARFDDYPFQYSGGMRQRIVIAIALSCQPKILICDEPTTALDVTIQAQILKLIKDLQKEFNYTIVFITHDLGVVANIADRVAVLYAGQIVELGTVDEIFYDPRHPYTWALLSSLPQLAGKDTKLYSITGTPPSLYNNITGDAFAPRNPYCLKVDTLLEPPMFKVTDTHFAKTWLLDERAPKIEKPESIQDIHSKIVEAFNI